MGVSGVPACRPRWAAQKNRRTALLDADLGLANVEVLLGLNSLYNLQHVITGERTMMDVMVEGPGGIQIIPGSSGIAKVADMGAKARQNVLNERTNIEVLDLLSRRNSAYAEAGKLSDTHEPLVIPFQQTANSVPLGFMVSQTDQVWLNFLNNWMQMKHEIGYFKSLNEKWGIQGQE